MPLAAHQIYTAPRRYIPMSPISSPTRLPNSGSQEQPNDGEDEVGPPAIAVTKRWGRGG